jgi:hypothetical protein
MAREGVPLIVIQRQLGHTNLGITSVYLQASTTPRSSTPSTPAARRWSPSTARSGANAATGGGKAATCSPPALVEVAGHEPGGERLPECSIHREAATHAA